jgi:hypothetical protein
MEEARNDARGELRLIGPEDLRGAVHPTTENATSSGDPNT